MPYSAHSELQIMRPFLLRTFGQVLFVHALLFAGHAVAAPVRLEETMQPEPAESPVSPAPVPAKPATTRPIPVVATGPAANPHAFDPASELRAKPPRAPESRSLSQGPEPANDGDGLNPELKRAAKAARQWVDDAIPWAQSSTPADATAKSSAGEGADADSASFEDRASRYPGPAGDRPAARAGARADDFRIASEVSKFAAEVLRHPLTWLVIAVMALGRGLVSLSHRRTHTRAAKAIRKKSRKAVRGVSRTLDSRPSSRAPHSDAVRKGTSPA